MLDNSLAGIVYFVSSRHMLSGGGVVMVGVSI